MNLRFLIFVVIAMQLFNCKNEKSDIETTENIEEIKTPFVWNAANIYFLLIDRFNNGDPTNDVSYGRDEETGFLTGYEGGDLKGVIQKIEEGYFTDLGINAIWMTPIVEQNHGTVDEGKGVAYGYHGYWTKDWTSIDANLGTKDDLKKLVEVAHSKGIRVLLDAVINHTSPVTDKDPVWPEGWVRTGPRCDYSNYENTITCTLVDNLPDIRTESNESVELPPQLVEKWKTEGRYDQEVAELEEFFERTGYPRAPRFYIMKWLTDYITEFGIDGYRVDTVKHTEEYVWQEFRAECDYAFAQFKQNNPEKVLDDNGFYLVGEVYNYNISGKRFFDFGDRKVDYFDKSFDALINFEIKWNAAQQEMETMFSNYSRTLNEMAPYGTLNYLTSHDDGSPFDKERAKGFEAATKLLLTPGASQVYYGDEVLRPLIIEGAMGDGNLRSLMNWEMVYVENEVLLHYQKLGQFRRDNPAVGAGAHKLITESPYVFSRSFSKNDYNNNVVVAINLKEDQHINVSSIFDDGTILKDAYSGQLLEVEKGQVKTSRDSKIVLLARQ